MPPAGPMGNCNKQVSVTRKEDVFWGNVSDWTCQSEMKNQKALQSRFKQEIAQYNHQSQRSAKHTSLCFLRPEEETSVRLTICTSSLEAEPVASVSTAPQPFWKEPARKWATLGGTPHFSDPSSFSWAKISSKRVTLKNTHRHIHTTHL